MDTAYHAAQSAAPKERVNITYKPSGNAPESVELPLKLLALGDYTGRKDNTPVASRKIFNINKHNFDEVLAAQNICLEFTVPSRIHKGAEIPSKSPRLENNNFNQTSSNSSQKNNSSEELSITLPISKLKDFQPDSIINTIPELKRLLAIREALVSLKGPLGNQPHFRKKLSNYLKDPELKSKLAKALEGGV